MSRSIPFALLRSSTRFHRRVASYSADAIEAVRKGDADLGMIAVENSSYGRVADVHSLLPESGLHIVDEQFVRVHVNLLSKPGAKLSEIRRAMGHVVILPQCGIFLRENQIKGVVSSDNAKAARDVAEGDDFTVGALASELAADIYGLDVVARHIEDHDRNTTRFLVMARAPDLKKRGDHGMMTSLVFRVRNIPAALQFSATQFYAEVEGHPDDRNLQLALEELDYFTNHLHILGVYPAAARRHEKASS